MSTDQQSRPSTISREHIPSLPKDECVVRNEHDVLKSRCCLASLHIEESAIGDDIKTVCAECDVTIAIGLVLSE